MFYLRSSVETFIVGKGSHFVMPLFRLLFFWLVVRLFVFLIVVFWYRNNGDRNTEGENELLRHRVY